MKGQVSIRYFGSSKFAERISWISSLLGKYISKNPIQGMYEQLENQGITPGKEVRA